MVEIENKLLGSGSRFVFFRRRRRLSEWNRMFPVVFSSARKGPGRKVTVLGLWRR